MSRAAAAAFLAASLDRFADAEAAAGAHDVRVAIAGRTIRLRFAGPALAAQIVPTFRHIVTEAEPAARVDFTIHVWDSASTGVPMLPPPFSIHDVPANGEVVGWSFPRLRVMFRGLTAMLSIVDVDAAIGMVWLRAGDQFNHGELATPLRHVLAPWFEATGLCLAHAGAVGGPDGGVLLAGPSGSGKSTTALYCLAAGLGYAADDQILVDVETGRAHALYATAKIWPPTLERFPALAPLFAGAAPAARNEKLVTLVTERVCPSFPLRAIFLPRLTQTPGAAPILRRISAGQTLRGLAPSTIIQLTGTATPGLAAMASLVGRVPGYQLDLGDDPAAVPPVIAAFLEGKP